MPPPDRSVVHALRVLRFYQRKGMKKSFRCKNFSDYSINLKRHLPRQTGDRERGHGKARKDAPCETTRSPATGRQAIGNGGGQPDATVPTGPKRASRSADRTEAHSVISPAAASVHFGTERHSGIFSPVPFRAKYRPATQNPQAPNGRAKKRRLCRRTPSYGTASGERPEFPHRTNHGDDKQKEESRHRPVVISVSRARRPTVAKETAASKQADIAQSNASTYRSIRILDRQAAVRFSGSILNGKLWICGNRRSTVSTTSQNREAKGTPHIARRPPPSSVSPWRPKGTGI